MKATNKDNYVITSNPGAYKNVIVVVAWRMRPGVTLFQ